MEKLKSEGGEEEGDGDSGRLAALRPTATRRQAAAKARNLPRNSAARNNPVKSEEPSPSKDTADQSTSKAFPYSGDRRKGGAGVEEDVAGVACSKGAEDSLREAGGEEAQFRLSFHKSGRAKKGKRRGGCATSTDGAGGDAEVVTTSSPLSPPTKDVTSSTNQDEESERRSSVPAPRLPAKPMAEKPKLAPMLLMNNLPYMGELTFDTRPRRGRKPKKADICHLISKNYGIQFPNSYTNCPNTGSFPTLVTPSGNVQPFSATISKKAAKKPLGRKPPSAWKRGGGECGGLPPELLPLNSSFPACGRRASPSALSFNLGLSADQRPPQPAKSNNSDQISRMYNGGGGGTEMIGSSPSEEPLNLCLRDSPSLPSNCSTPRPFSAAQSFNPSASPVRIPIVSSKEAAGRKIRKGKSSVEAGLDGSMLRDAHLVNNVQSESPARKTASRLNSNLSCSMAAVQPLGKMQRGGTFSAAPNAKVKGKRKRASMFVAPPECRGTAAGQSEATPKEKPPKGPEGGQSVFGQQNSGSRAEVSICKFKFTGGAKPSLQEKKMLSVDSGGNFRFYTDKATPSSSKSFRNSISSSSGGTDLGQDSQHYPLSSLPKSAKSMSMCMPVPVTSMTSLSISKGGTLSSFCQLSKPTEPTPAASASRVSSSTSFAPAAPAPFKSKNKPFAPSCGSSEPSTTSSFVGAGPESPTSSSDNSNSNSQRFPEIFGGRRATSETSRCVGSSSVNAGPATGSLSSNKLKMKRKRRTRKSLMREKLEKTFKEKGFLIQTQQLESAEGATYCKFRQLRKFTRYLFRSWKDYLPDNVKDIQRGPGALPPSTDTSSPTSPPPTHSAIRLQASVGDGGAASQSGLVDSGLVGSKKKGCGGAGRRGPRGECHKSESSSMEVDGEEDDERESEGGSEDEDEQQESQMYEEEEEEEEEPTSSYLVPSRPDSGSDEEVDMDDDEKFGYPAAVGDELEEEGEEESEDSDNGDVP